MDRKWVIVAFGDMSNFMEWMLRASNSPEVQSEFINALYDKFQVFVLKTKAEVFKYLGDGFMVLKELPDNGHKCRDVMPFLKEAHQLTLEINEMLGKFSPKPNLFLLRSTAGYVFRIKVVDPRNKSKKMSEHVGTCIDLAKRLGELKPDVACICSQSVKDILPEGSQASFQPIKNIKERPRNVSESELNSLLEFRF
jgi:hypothetical protein